MSLCFGLWTTYMLQYIFVNITWTLLIYQHIRTLLNLQRAFFIKRYMDHILMDESLLQFFRHSRTNTLPTEKYLKFNFEQNVIFTLIKDSKTIKVLCRRYVCWRKPLLVKLPNNKTFLNYATDGWATYINIELCNQYFRVCNNDFDEILQFNLRMEQ